MSVSWHNLERPGWSSSGVQVEHRQFKICHVLNTRKCPVVCTGSHQTCLGPAQVSPNVERLIEILPSCLSLECDFSVQDTGPCWRTSECSDHNRCALVVACGGSALAGALERHEVGSSRPTLLGVDSCEGHGKPMATCDICVQLWLCGFCSDLLKSS